MRLKWAGIPAKMSAWIRARSQSKSVIGFPLIILRVVLLPRGLHRELADDLRENAEYEWFADCGVQ
ncbi:MAG TPA: hypothetical protein VHZ03_40310 [Trebonia sp.]|jgi:hypothetical protein|nr:hypothetical protein [Trebonia sp.]